MDDVVEPVLCPLCAARFYPDQKLTADNVRRVVIATGLRAADHLRQDHDDEALAGIMESVLMENMT